MRLSPSQARVAFPITHQHRRRYDLLSRGPQHPSLFSIKFIPVPLFQPSLCRNIASGLDLPLGLAVAAHVRCLTLLCT